MVYHLTGEDYSRAIDASNRLRKDEYMKVLDEVKMAIAMMPDPPSRWDEDPLYSNISQQFQILEGLLLKATT